MKAILKAKVLEVVKEGAVFRDGNTDVCGLVKLKLRGKGKVDTSLTNAQMLFWGGELFLKETIANQMKIGATITVTLSDEEASEE